MMRLCEIVGLTTSEMAEVTGYVMATISFSVFMGILMAIALYSFVDFIGMILCLLTGFIRKRIPSVRKN